MEAALVFDNPHSEYTMEALRASWGQMISAISRALNETENQILIRDSKGLTEEQITEYRKSFNYFDKVWSLGVALRPFGYDLWNWGVAKAKLCPGL